MTCLIRDQLQTADDGSSHVTAVKAEIGMTNQSVGQAIGGKQRQCLPQRRRRGAMLLPVSAAGSWYPSIVRGIIECFRPRASSSEITQCRVLQDISMRARLCVLRVDFGAKIMPTYHV